MSMGAGKHEEAEKTLGAVFTLSVGLGILFTVVCLIFLKPLVLAFGATEGALSAVGIVLRISTVVISICVEIGVGIQPIIGFNQGAGLGSRVKETFRKAVGVATVVSVIGWLVCVLFPAQILRLFGMGDPAYLKSGVCGSFCWVCWWLVFKWCHRNIIWPPGRQSRPCCFPSCARSC